MGRDGERVGRTRVRVGWRERVGKLGWGGMEREGWENWDGERGLGNWDGGGMEREGVGRTRVRVGWRERVGKLGWGGMEREGWEN